MMPRTPLSRLQTRRGSVFILVVAVLSVLALLTLTLSYMSRMDLLAARNWGDTVQARMAAVTGFPPLTGSVPQPDSSLAPATAKATMNATNSQADGEAPAALAPERRGVRNRGLGRGTMAGLSSQGMMNGAGGRLDDPAMTPASENVGYRFSSELKPLNLDLGYQAEWGIEAWNNGMALQNRGSRYGVLPGAALAAQQGNRYALATGWRVRKGTAVANGRVLPGYANRASGGLQTSPARATLAAAGMRDAAATSNPLATALVEDESAKININAVLPAELAAAQKSTVAQDATRQNAAQNTYGQSQNGLTQQNTTGSVQTPPDAVTETELAQLIQSVAAINKISGVDAKTLARRIALRRFGADGKPGRDGNDDRVSLNGAGDPYARQANAQLAGRTAGPLSRAGAAWNSNYPTGRTAGNNMMTGGSANSVTLSASANGTANQVPAPAIDDLRKPPAGDDKPYGSLADLMSVPGMTPALYKALTPYLTTFSVSFAAYQIKDQESRSDLAADQGQSGLAGTANRISSGGTDEAWEAMRAQNQTAVGLPQVDPNTAKPELLYEVLKQRFPKAGDDLLGQFIANLIDRRDADDLPTAVTLAGKTYYGMEINPCINEVCPDPAYGDATKGGQFVELYNPWSKTFSLTGWTLRGQGVGVQLTGSLPSGAYMVLTNNFNNESKTEADNSDSLGSFYNVFHKVATGPQHQLVEVQGLALPADKGKIQLVNPDGMVVDEFEYTGGTNNGAAKSFQRHDPRLRTAELAPPTPLDANNGMAPAGSGNRNDAEMALKVMEQWQNQPFRSPLDVMLVSTAYARTDNGTPGTADAVDAGADTAPEARTSAKYQPYALPVLNASDSDNLDVRMVDCFRVGAVLPARQVRLQDGATGTNNNSRSAMAQRLLAQSGLSQDMLANLNQSSTPEAPRCMATFGRINLNTAPLAVIATLPGMTQQMLQLFAASRDSVASFTNLVNPLNGMANSASQANAVSAAANTTVRPTDPAWWTGESPFAPPRWQNLSDLILDETLWSGRPLYDRLDAVYPFSQMVTLHTLSVRVVTVNRPDAAAPQRGQAAARRPSVSCAERLIAGDRGGAETVSFSYLTNAQAHQADPDLRSAKPAAGQMQKLNLAALMNQAQTAGTRHVTSTRTSVRR